MLWDAQGGPEGRCYHTLGKKGVASQVSQVASPVLLWFRGARAVTLLYRMAGTFGVRWLGLINWMPLPKTLPATHPLCPNASTPCHLCEPHVGRFKSPSANLINMP